VLVEKPCVSIKHNGVASYLGFALANHLDRGVYRVNINGGRAQYTPRTFYIPNVIVIPAGLVLPYLHDPMAFGAFAESLPLVAEVWSLTLGNTYDIAAKLPLYRARGGAEIWFIHPYERTLTAWRRQPDGSYSEEHYQGGIVPGASLPGVTIDLNALLDG
jgi:Uma2 family endonuclease